MSSPTTPRTGRRRSRFLVGALALALAGSLAACGSGTDDDADSAGRKSSGAFPAKVATKFGTITVEEQPKRVVALGWGDAETALALGVQPVGASDWLAFGGDGLGPWVTAKYDKSPQKIGTLEPEYEKIAALEPDLILDTKSSGDQTRYDTLSKIAPTVGVPKGGDQYKQTWKKQTTMVAQALGVPEKGERLIADTEKQFSEAAAAHPEFKDKTITIGSRTASTWGAYVRGTGRVDFVERLGFENNPAVEKKAGKAFSVPVSEENLQMLDADLMVMAPIGTTAKKISSDPLYASIPAAKKGHSVVFDDKDISSAFATDSILSVQYALEHVVPLFAEAMEK
ncbi:iron-siderophore ABC transporter substrate-binding protein [Streptomyces kunmingensis]|uniref:Iron-siderophore ABC transporter substrate-binding protein n=1 Tax=Streptomyces kunmingensis TaxID=68225 RepID=A0ABU6CCZ6_9ACTN|nr:iron-siderophore ABC transporter substrate-binding protein [Streptomyces kunmingensis]MEB3962046.1 iron-siderophore ABC transporter substrate-binding protein [Streptomyces kunmingensis]